MALHKSALPPITHRCQGARVFRVTCVSDMPSSESRFLADLHDLNRPQVLPMLEPHVEEVGVICLHQLKAPITVLLQPTVHVDQTIGQHSALLMKSLIDSVF